LHVLAKAGGTIREQLAESSRCVAWNYWHLEPDNCM
jgi:hypothetical protein